MSCYRDLCSSSSVAPCRVSCPQPLTDTWNEPCVTSCGDSRAVVYPPPVVITFPGPILSSCPQQSVVGSSAPSAIGSTFGYGASFGHRGSLAYRGSLGSRFSSCSQRSQCYSSRSSEPCDIQQEYTRTRSSQDTTCKTQTQE